MVVTIITYLQYRFVQQSRRLGFISLQLKQNPHNIIHITYWNKNWWIRWDRLLPQFPHLDIAIGSLDIWANGAQGRSTFRGAPVCHLMRNFIWSQLQAVRVAKSP